MMEKVGILDKKKILDNYFEKKKEIIENHYQGETGLNTVKTLSDLTDETIKQFANISFDNPEDISIVVLGGYGRQELCFKSDIDISLVFDEANFEKIKAGLESFYYMLLDLKVDIGFSPRDIKTFMKLADEDLTVATSLLQGRFLWGNKETYEKLIKKFKNLIKRKRNAYINATLKARKTRYEKTGSSIYMMEPHVKEGEGGLRDFHEVFWIAKVLDDVEDYKYFVEKNIILEEEYVELMRAYDFILKIRNQMHLICNKKCDVLVFPLQEEVAKKLGFALEDDDEETLRSSVEQMMKLYYLNAKSINTITKRILKNLTEQEDLEVHTPIDDIFARTSTELEVLNPKKFENNPVNILKAFKYYKDYYLDFSSQLEYLLRKNEKKLKEQVNNPELQKIVREIFSSEKNLPNTLRKMQDFYVIDDLIPEFGYQRCYFQYDAYHKYTTDAHAIKAVEVLEGLKKLDNPHKKTIHELYKDVERKDLLIWAIFLHDIGKGHKTDHSVLGAKMAFDILTRFGYSKRDAKIVSDLVLYHLEMAKISQRRNINDPKVLDEFIKIVKNTEFLKMLTVLTWCDANAVGPNVWNDWKQTLLMELYTKAYNILKEGISAEEYNNKIFEEKLQKVKAFLTEKYGSDIAQHLLSRVSDYYLISMTTNDIIKHLQLEYKLLKTADPQFYFEENINVGFSEIVMAVNDVENPLLVFTGIISSMGLNILSIYSFARKDGTRLIEAHISTPALESVNYQKFEKFLNIFEEYRKGIITLEDIKKTIKYKGFKVSTVPPPTFVKIDNKTSDKYTIFDISAEDRIGLLFDIIYTFSKFNIYVHIAKVTTQGERARDAFYVRTPEKEKITDEEILENVKKELLKVIKT
jgi:[protein-PII] uridylyltransferase